MIKKDLTGQRFGKLALQYPTQKRMLRGKVHSRDCLSKASIKDYIGKGFDRVLMPVI